MPSLDLSQSILSGAADYTAGPFNAGATADLTVHAAAALKRGIDLELGVSAMAQMDAAFSYFLAADAEVRAQASAQLKGQVQVPIDLFGEAGVAVRLQAMAQLGVSARLAVGLAMGDFIALAEQDPRIRGIALKLLIIFLEELQIQGGVMARAAVAAKAYVNVSISGRLLADDGPIAPLPEGFTIAAEMGAGLKGGVGWQMFANLGLKDTRRMIRRTVDAVVDEVVHEASEYIDDDVARRVLRSLRAPAKMALRTGFELGLTVAERSSLFADSGPELARRSVMILLEEAQRYLLELFIELSSEAFQAALTALGASPTAWNDSESQRLNLASTLRSMPDEPFELTTDNVTYWLEVVNGSVSVALELGGEEVIDADWVEPVAVTWCAVQLMLSGLQRLNNGSARVSFLGAYSASVKTPAFAGALVGPPAPNVIANHVRAKLGVTNSTTLTQDHLVEYLVDDILLQKLVDEVPEVEPFLEIIAGPQNIGLVAAAKVVLGNLGAFIPDPQNPSSFDPIRTLEVLSEGLEAYILARVDGELQPYLHQALGNRPDLKLYIDDVLLATLRFSVGTVLQRVVNWSAGDILARDAFREACSSIVMKLLGRSLVVTTDVLMARAMQEMSGQFTDFATHVDDPGGVAQGLAQLTNLNQDVVSELMVETLTIAADVFRPLPNATRARIRELLYDIVDTLPADADDGFVEQLKHDFFIPNEELLLELAEELGITLIDLLGRFVSRVLSRIAQIVLQELAGTVDDIALAVVAWAEDLADAVAALYARLLELPGEITALLEGASQDFESALNRVSNLLEQLSGANGQAAIRTTVRDYTVDVAQESLSLLPAYTLLDANNRAAVRADLRSTVGSLIDTDILNPVLNAIGSLADTADTIVDDIRELANELSAVDPQADLAGQIAELLLDRIEDAAHSVFGTQLLIPLKLDITISVTPPKVWGPIRWAYGAPVEWGWIQPPSVEQTLYFDLGTITIPVDSLMLLVRTALSQLEQLEDVARDLADSVLAHIEALVQANVLEAEQQTVSSLHEQAQRQLLESRAPTGELDMTVIAPTAGAIYRNDVEVEIALFGVPASFLGLGALEQERLFVWINQEPVEPDKFVIEQRPTPDERPGINQPPNSRNSERDPSDTQLTGPYIFTANDVNAWGQHKRTSTSDGAISAELQPRYGATSLKRGVPAPVEALTRATMSAAQFRGLKTVKGNRSGQDVRRRHTDTTSTKAKRNGPGALRRVQGLKAKNGPTNKHQQNTSAEHYKPGKGLRRPERESLIGELDPDLVVRFIVPIESLTEGPNSLHVALVDGEVLRIEETAVFLAAVAEPAKKAAAGKRQPKPLGEIRWKHPDLDFLQKGKFDNRPHAERDTAHAHIENTAAANRSDASSGSNRTGEPGERRRPKKSTSSFWIAERATRDDLCNSAAGRITQRLEAPRRALRETAQAVKRGKLRPVPLVRNSQGDWTELRRAVESTQHRPKVTTQQKKVELKHEDVST